MKKVSVCLLTHDSLLYLRGCLVSVVSQTYPNLEVVVVDNASSDGTAAFLRREHPSLRLVENSSNLGYSGGHNIGIRSTDGDYVLLLNPDVILNPDYVALLVEALERDDRAGAAMGKLYTLGSRYQPEPVFDSVGVCVSKNRRTLDRGQGEVDRGQYDGMVGCFGPSGAAPLYRRAMLNDVAVAGEYFDEDFFAYREEVDLAWRSRILGWSCVFEPRAIGYHDRSYTPRTRADMPASLRQHMTKNRYLLLLKNDRASHILRHLPHVLWFELLFWGHALVFEPYLFGSLVRVRQLVPRMLEKRRTVMERRRWHADEMLGWFE